MTNVESKARAWKVKAMLPIIGLGLFCCSFVSTSQQTKSMSQLTKDYNIAIDTIIIFDPATGKETMKIVSSEDLPVSKLVEPTVQTGIDTVITFDLATKKEVMMVIDHSTRKRKVID